MAVADEWSGRQAGGKEKKMTPDVLSDRLWKFAVLVGRLVDRLPGTRLGRHVAGQLVRCGTAAPPNYDEARSGESKGDFIHKLSIAMKELAESRGWIRFTLMAELLPDQEVAAVLDECNQLCRIVGKSLATAKANRHRPPPTTNNK